MYRFEGLVKTVSLKLFIHETIEKALLACGSLDILNQNVRVLV
jgi:hypothetical protein